MAGKKVKVAFICNISARKECYRKRKKGIIKKMREIKILCDIPACAIISNPFNSNNTEVWPDLEEAKQVIERYQNLSQIDKTKNVNQESFVLQRLTKAREKLEKQRQEIRDKEMTIRMIQYMKNKNLPDDVSVSDLKHFQKLIEENLKDIDNKLNGSN
ncbi:agamous-like mads-box protein agl80-like [Trifolium pratense]|uniref:Agamous-like mads-box protein agl80-like n=1 Tax=Trifolium pratense TaxID=57577 RepID=A0A2K3M4B5_TRIPR|nr:agamous-like MADS-box protein AGL80 [Trifolium pratense]PNX85604.1 agamous-like mads-box protein agl80-like [Trifolium pratense]